MSSRSSKILREQEWEKRKIKIWHLLLQEKRQVGEIRDQMRKEGFCATLKEYESRFKSWGFYLNNPMSTKKYITHRVEKRKRQGKRSTVVVAGIQWSDEKLKKEICRNFYSTQEKLRDPSPCTPPGPMVSVCSPSPADLVPPSEWPAELPWLQFSKMLFKAPFDLIWMMVQRLREVRLGLDMNEIAVFEDRLTLQHVAHHLGLSLPEDISSPIKLSIHLRTIMPETIPGEHLMRSQIFTNDSDIPAREFLILVLYQISNRLSGDIVCQARRDELLLELIIQSGLVGSKHQVLEGPTVHSILEETWRAALRRCRSSVISWLLDLGIDVDLHFLGSEYFRHEGEETLRALLAYRASPDRFCCQHHGTPLELAIRRGLLGIVEMFVEHGINTQGQVYLQQMDFGKLLLLPDWDIPQEIQHGMLTLIQDVFEKANPSPGDLFDTLLSADGLITAARYGCSALLSKLRAKGADFNCHDGRGEFPMGAAIACRGSHDGAIRCMTLIELGASVNYEPKRDFDRETGPSALHIAALMGDDDTLKALLRNGAHQHAPASFNVGRNCLYGLGGPVKGEADYSARSPLSWALSKPSKECALLLLEAGAPIEGHELLLYLESCCWNGDSSTDLITTLIKRGAPLHLKNSSGETALDLAVRKGCHGATDIFLRAGATMNPATSLDWLSYFETFIATNDDCGEEEFNRLLEEFYRLYPCVSVASQNARLEGLSESYCNHWNARRSDTVIASVLRRYPQAYSSIALGVVLRSPEKASCLPTLSELLRRRRPEFIEESIEWVTVSCFVNYALTRKSSNLLAILDVLLSQQPGLNEIRSPIPGCSPLVPALGRCLGWALFKHRAYSAEDVGFVIAVLGRFLDAGFRVSAVIGLFAIGAGCSVHELEQLMALGFDPRQRYRWSHTALQLAMRRNDLEMVRFLVGHGVNVNSRPRWGSTPKSISDISCWSWSGIDHGPHRTALQFAVENGNWECAQLLVASGADVNAPPARIGGATALQVAAMQGYVGLVDWLVSSGAEIHAREAPVEGMTAMEGAAAFGRMDVVGLLLQRGDFGDGEGRRQYVRAVGYARKLGHHALASYMAHQVGWSDEDEEMLAREDLLESVTSFVLRYTFEEDDCCDKSCVGEIESVDDAMEEPGCCYAATDPRNQSSYSQDIRSTNQGQGEFELSGEETALWMSWMNQPDMVVTPASSEVSDEFWASHSQILADIDWGFLADAQLGHEKLETANGPMVGKNYGNKCIGGEQSHQRLLQEWTHIFRQRNEIVQSEQGQWGWSGMGNATEPEVDVEENELD
ncbi:uncharacterized protein PG998_006491 [Apiospora kogelbergensis]|uniref:uncharacterized protein n=1 Tax=Apiospora kogelbergensis TaxID=1337665 RepID=UPI003132614B